MKKNKLLVLLASTSILAVGGVLFATRDKQSPAISADGCTHTHVEHYIGFSDTKTGAGYVEHWACCECHTAWADESKTVVIGNTIDDRKNIDLDFALKADWGASMMAPTYENGIVTFTNDKFHIDEVTLGNSDPYHYIQIIGTRVLKENEYAELSVINRSSAETLNVSFLEGVDWVDLGIGSYQCKKDVANVIKFSSDKWNLKPRFLIKEPSKIETNGTLVLKVEFKTMTKKINFGTGGITLLTESIKEVETYPVCSKTEFEDKNVGVAYKYEISPYDGDVKNDSAFWTMNRTQVDTILDGFGSEMDIYIPDNGSNYKFAIQDSVVWTQVEKPLVNGQWNHIVIDSEFVKSLTFGESTNAGFFRIISTDFNTNDIALTPIYKREIEKTNLKFGIFTDSGENHETFGNIYNFSRGEYYIQNKITDTFGDVKTGLLRDSLSKGKTQLIFAVYNPLDKDVSFHVDGGVPWSAASRTTLGAKAWTTVVLGSIDFALNDTGTVYFYGESTDITGWLFTDIWSI